MAGHRAGFGALPVEKRREVARRGGIAVHAKGRAYEWDSAAARAAGAKGGRAKRRLKDPAIAEQGQ